MTPDEARQRAVEAAVDAYNDADSDFSEPLRAPLVEAIAAYERALWQPIETAPKDGSRFIAWFPPCPQLIRGGWHETQWRKRGWYHPFFVEPTHWRPLLDGPGDGA